MIVRLVSLSRSLHYSSRLCFKLADALNKIEVRYRYSVVYVAKDLPDYGGLFVVLLFCIYVNVSMPSALWLRRYLAAFSLKLALARIQLYNAV